MVHLPIRCGSFLIRGDPNGTVFTPDFKIAAFDCRAVDFHFFHRKPLVAVPPSATTAAAAIAATATEVPLHHGSRFIDGQRASIELRTVEGRNGFAGTFVFHEDEAETFRTTGIPIRNDID